MADDEPTPAPVEEEPAAADEAPAADVTVADEEPGDEVAAEEAVAAANQEPLADAEPGDNEHPDENPEPAGETEASQEAPGPPSEDTSAADQEAPEGTAEEATQEQEVDGEPKPEEEGADEEGEDGQTEGEKPASPAEGEPQDGGEEKGEQEGEETATAHQPDENAVNADNEKPTEGENETAGEPIPQSDTFADGEQPQSPAPHIGEVLSQPASPREEEQGEHGHTFTPPEALSPRDSHDGEHMDMDALEEEMMSPEQDREALTEMYHQAIGEREQLLAQNHQLQHKLAEYFRKKKSDEQRAEGVDKNEADQDQRYLKYMSTLEELRAEDQQIREAYSNEIEDLQARCNERQTEVDAHRAKFVEFKHQVALNSLNSRSGKPIPPKDVEGYLLAEDKKDQEVIAVRLENIKLKNKLKKKEQQLKSKEELADGLHLIDFEQLKIENQTYNEKIEERNEELLKLRKKITNTVQVLTHLKEKLQFVQAENTLLKSSLREVEGKVAQKRDVLTRTKQARDALRIDNHRLRQNCGLLGNEPLLRDFEDRKDEADALRERLERLKMQHAELTLNTTRVRKKIQEIKAIEQN